MKLFYALTSILLFVVCLEIFGQESLLNAGPMVGHSQMREVTIWVQTNTEADVKILYHNTKAESTFYETNSVRTAKDNAFTAHLIADMVEEGQTYNYDLYINDQKINFDYPLEFQTQKLWQWREDPPEFSFATGSGAYINEPEFDRPGTPYGGNLKIYHTIYEKDPDFMLWLGDNVYLREADYYSRTGILKRYTYHRSTPELQPLLGSVHHYAIWDDHDFGPNNSDRSYILKDVTLEAFKLFWANPSYGVNGKPGTTTYFQWGVIDFFLMDNRYYRTPEYRDHIDRKLLGDEQLDWLIDALVNSRAPFKIVAMGGQALTPIDKFETYTTFPAEKEKLLQLIQAEGIIGVIFLTGDRHLTELTKMERRGTYPLYDFTISPLTSGPNTYEPEPNFYRVDGTLVQQRNFAVFNFSGSRKDRKLKCTVFDTEGKELWSYSIHENELK
ncbi:alkaline phosphatase D family protein [Bacteroidota bacterium]